MPQIVKNIVRLEAVSPAALTSLIIVPGRGAYSRGKAIPSTVLELVQPAEVRDSTKTVDQTKVHTVQLTAVLPERIDVDGRPMAFFATAADGSRWLIGNADKPYPVADIEDVLPSKFSDRSACTLQVQWTGTVGLLQVF